MKFFIVYTPCASFIKCMSVILCPVSLVFSYPLLVLDHSGRLACRSQTSSSGYLGLAGVMHAKNGGGIVKALMRIPKFNLGLILIQILEIEHYLGC